MSDVQNIKEQTLALYKSLPQDKQLRKSRIDIRDQIIALNYKFFNYIATTTYVTDPYVTFEDKYDSAVLHFCECWWQYLWEGDESHRGYRTDISFAVFFRPRLQEMLRRELNIVKYSVRRSLCMKVGKLLDKSWTLVCYEDLADSRVKLPEDERKALMAIFGATYNADMENVSLVTASTLSVESRFEDITYEYDDIEHLLITEMVEREHRLTESMLKQMSVMYTIPIEVLKYKLPIAESMLYEQLHEEMELKSNWRHNDFNSANDCSE